MDTDDRKQSQAAKILLSPLILLNKGLSALLRKAIGGNYGGNITENDILSLVDAGNETGAIEDNSVEMINNIFEFNDLCASDVMTHRVNITAIEANDSLDNVIYLALEKGFSRLPVFEGNLDKIIGIVIVKDLLCLIGDQHLEQFQLKDFIRDAVFIPESCSCSDTFTFLTSQKTGMAVVIDEYGGTAGIVTLEDLIESVMGNIQDEYDDEDMLIKKINDDKYEINGEADPDEVLELFGYSLPDEHEYDTISGFVTDLLGYLPESAEGAPHADYKDIRFVIVDVCDNCAERIIAFRNKTSEEKPNSAE